MTTIKLCRVDIFISSPGDVEPERALVKQVIEDLNRRPAFSNKYVFKAYDYKELTPPVVGGPAQNIVNNYMIRPDGCYLLICILWSRMGTRFVDAETGREFVSGTAYEFETAYDSFRTKGIPHVLLFRKDIQNASADPAQLGLVNAFFDRFKGGENAFEGLHKRFKTQDEFRRDVALHIEQILVKHPPEKDPNYDPDARLRHLRRRATELADARKPAAKALEDAKFAARVKQENRQVSNTDFMQNMVALLVIAAATLGSSSVLQTVLPIPIGLVIAGMYLTRTRSTPPTISAEERVVQQRQEALQHIDAEIQSVRLELAEYGD